MLTIRHYVLIICLSLLCINNNIYAADSAALTNKDTSQCQLNILLTNDDGWQAPGIQRLFQSLQQSGYTVTMVAPLSQQSGRGSAINTAVGSSVSIKQQANNVWSVDGTPADSVKAALGIVMADHLPDLVVSGANFGPNVGQQTVLNSGTLGASLTAYHAGLPAIAVSVGMDLSERKSKPAYASTLAGFDKASSVLNGMLSELNVQNGCNSPLAGKNILSINIPVPVQQIKGLRYAPLSPNELFRLTWHTENKLNKITFNQADKSAALHNDDVGYFLRKYITVTPINGDLTQQISTDGATQAPWLPDLIGLDSKHSAKSTH